MKLAHSLNDCLSCLLVTLHLEGRIFFRETLQCFTHLFPIPFCLWLDSHRDNRLRETWWLESDFKIFIPQGVTRGNVLQSNRRRDIPCKNCINIFPFIRLNLNQATHPLPLSGA